MPDQIKLRGIWITLIGTMLIAAVSAIASLSQAAGSEQTRINEHERRILLLENKVDPLVKDVAEIKTDVRWIRAALGGNRHARDPGGME